MKKSKKKRLTTFDRQFYVMILPLLGLIILFLFFPFLFTSRSWFGIDFTETGQIGDTIGGILSPFIAIVAAILTFLHFGSNLRLMNNRKRIYR